MIRTFHRASSTGPAAPMFTGEHLVDPLAGPVPSWRPATSPIYDLLVAELGRPGSLVGPAPSAVVAGVVVDGPAPSGPVVVEAPPTVPIAIRATTAIPVTGRGGRKRRNPSARRAAS